MTDAKPAKTVDVVVLKNFALEIDGRLVQFKNDDTRQSIENRVAGEENREPQPVPPVSIPADFYEDLFEKRAVKRAKK